MNLIDELLKTVMAIEHGFLTDKPRFCAKACDRAIAVIGKIKESTVQPVNVIQLFPGEELEITQAEEEN